MRVCEFGGEAVSRYSVSVNNVTTLRSQTDHLRFLTVGRSKLCFMPALIWEWNLMLSALLSAHAASNCVVSWSTRCVYLVRPERPKFFTCVVKTQTHVTDMEAPVLQENLLGWRPICTISDDWTLPLVHTVTVLKRRRNIWCYTAQHTTRLSGSRGQISTTKAIQDACVIW